MSQNEALYLLQVGGQNLNGSATYVKVHHGGVPTSQSQDIDNTPRIAWYSLPITTAVVITKVKLSCHERS